MKNLKKLLCFTLVLVMSLSMSLTALAQTPETPYNTIIIQDNEQVRIAQTSDEEMIYTTTFDKINNSIQMTVTSIKTNEVTVGDTVFINAELQEELTPSTRASLNENTFTNYEYTKTYGNPNTWELRRPDNSIFSTYHFKTKETSSNSSSLSNFKGYVDSINSLEGQIIMALGANILSLLVASAAGAGAIFSGGTLTAAAWGSIVAAAGVHTKYVDICMTYDRACKNAFDAYMTVFFKSDVYY